jgi:hypothetical protein
VAIPLQPCLATTLAAVLAVERRRPAVACPHHIFVNQNFKVAGAD